MGSNEPRAWVGGEGAVQHPCTHTGSLSAHQEKGVSTQLNNRNLKNGERFPGWDVWFLQHFLEVRREREGFRKLLGWLLRQAPPRCWAPLRLLGTEGWEGSLRPKEFRSSGFTMTSSGEGTQDRVWGLVMFLYFVFSSREQKYRKIVRASYNSYLTCAYRSLGSQPLISFSKRVAGSCLPSWEFSLAQYRGGDQSYRLWSQTLLGLCPSSGTEPPFLHV